MKNKGIKNIKKIAPCNCDIDNFRENVVHRMGYSISIKLLQTLPDACHSLIANTVETVAKGHDWILHHINVSNTQIEISIQIVPDISVNTMLDLLLEGLENHLIHKFPQIINEALLWGDIATETITLTDLAYQQKLNNQESN